jgi:predicted nucleic acid-binding Zn ribbon protein
MRHYNAATDEMEDDGMTREERRAAQLAAARACIRPPRTIRCAVCPARFTAKGRGRYCSDACRNRAYQARKREKQARAAPQVIAELRAALDACRIKDARRLCDELATILAP